MGPLALWQQSHLPAVEAKVIPRAPSRGDETLVREWGSAKGWRRASVELSSEGKTNTLHFGEMGVQ